MSLLLHEITEMIDRELKPELFNDYAPNGLQVEGQPRIQKIISGVTACELLLDKAIEAGANAILVHHGYFWKGENPCVTGMKRQRLQKLLVNGISLLAYHLPLDAHPVMGNNAQLAKKLDIEITGGLEEKTSRPIGNVGTLASPLSLDAFGKQIEKQLQHKPLLIKGHNRPVKTVAWCTGAAQSLIGEAASRGADAFISGEISERTVHEAREYGIHYIAAGHHATERYGVQALGAWLQENTGISHSFIDIPNPA